MANDFRSLSSAQRDTLNVIFLRAPILLTRRNIIMFDIMIKARLHERQYHSTVQVTVEELPQTCSVAHCRMSNNRVRVDQCDSNLDHNS